MLKLGSDIVRNKDIGKKYHVYNGKEYVDVGVSGIMVGRRFGEFILTRSKKVIKSDRKKAK